MLRSPLINEFEAVFKNSNWKMERIELYHEMGGREFARENRKAASSEIESAEGCRRRDAAETQKCMTFGSRRNGKNRAGSPNIHTL
jgi:hypothetical protein